MYKFSFDKINISFANCLYSNHNNPELRKPIISLESIYFVASLVCLLLFEYNKPNVSRIQFDIELSPVWNQKISLNSSCIFIPYVETITFLHAAHIVLLVSFQSVQPYQTCWLYLRCVSNACIHTYKEFESLLTKV